MKYDFKVNLTPELYSLFLEEGCKVELRYLDELKSKFDEFRIKYNNSPEKHSSTDIIDMIESANDHYQVLLVGVKNNTDTVLCYYFIGNDKDDAYYRKGVRDFNKMLKFKL